MHTLLFKEHKLLIIALLTLFSTTYSFGQNKLEGYLRIGHVNPHLEVNGWIEGGDAFVLGGIDGNLHPLIFGGEIRYRLKDYWIISSQLDFFTKFRHQVHIGSNRYYSSDQIRLNEFVDYSFSPVLIGSSIQRNFHIARGIHISPKAGVGLRFVNLQQSNVDRSFGSEEFDHARLIRQAFDESFKSFDPNYSFGLEMSHERVYVNFQYTFSMLYTSVNSLSIEGENFDVRARQSFGNLTIGYKVL